MQDKNLAILISSCDSYSDSWEPFFFFLEKHWPDCPYPIFLATNTKSYSRKNLTQLFSNKFTNWSDESSAVLQQFPYEYILYLQDDYFLTNKVDTEEVDNLFKKMEWYKADYLRLIPSPGPNKDFMNDSAIGLISESAEYRTCLQCAIWKKETFLNLLQQNESPWEFERNSPGRSGGYLFLSVKNEKMENFKRHIYPITYLEKTAIVKGKWHRRAVAICKKEGLKLDYNYRKVLTLSDEVTTKIYFSLPKPLQHVYDFIRFRFVSPFRRLLLRRNKNLLFF